MDDDNIYSQQVRLLVRTLPFIARQPVFALKGGTAINLFLQDMPRLSVDIDLAYLPIEDRPTSLQSCKRALNKIAEDMRSTSPQHDVREQFNKEDELRLLVHDQGAGIKVEVSPVLRGAVFTPVAKDIHPDVAETFGFAHMTVLSEPDLYGGKICAALDRQHPRDLFDVMLLLRTGGFSRAVLDGFLVYLISHGRPMAELLKPRSKDLTELFNNQFQGMTREPVELDQLIQAREDLQSEIARQLTDKDKQFLISIKRGMPDWSLHSVPGIDQLPAVQWKLQNVLAMQPDKHRQSLDNLERVLNQI